jgi:hypothetical protein
MVVLSYLVLLLMENNTVRANANIYANMGYARSNKLHVYDAGYIKLREASLTYNFSAEH